MKKYTIIFNILLLCIIGCKTIPLEISCSFHNEFVSENGFEHSRWQWNSSLEKVVENIGFDSKYYYTSETKENASVLHYYANPQIESVKSVKIQMEDLEWSVDQLGFSFQDNQLKGIMLMKSYESWEIMEEAIEKFLASFYEIILSDNIKEIRALDSKDVSIDEVDVKALYYGLNPEFVFEGSDGTYMVIRIWYDGEGIYDQRFISVSIISDKTELQKRFLLKKI